MNDETWPAYNVVCDHAMQCRVLFTKQMKLGLSVLEKYLQRHPRQ